ARGQDQLALLAAMAHERGMELTLEFAPPHPITNTLSTALAAIRQIDKPGVRLVIDAMHFFRSGGSAAELRAVAADDIGYVQLCDVPRVARIDEYYKEACFARLAPGDGELPLRELVAALPAHVLIGLEVPMLAEAEAGHDLHTIMGRAVAG